VCTMIFMRRKRVEWKIKKAGRSGFWCFGHGFKWSKQSIRSRRLDASLSCGSS
jgi:hypothetical protein